MANEKVEFIKKGDELLAIIIKSDYSGQVPEFFTPEHYPQQVGFILKKKGDVIKAHNHKRIKREIDLTQEVLIIRKGRVEVTLYDGSNEHYDTRILEQGDIILLTGGGHRYFALEDLEMVEIKQGPYLGKDDKVIFE